MTDQFDSTKKAEEFALQHKAETLEQCAEVMLNNRLAHSKEDAIIMAKPYAEVAYRSARLGYHTGARDSLAGMLATAKELGVLKGHREARGE